MPNLSVLKAIRSNEKVDITEYKRLYKLLNINQKIKLCDLSFSCLEDEIQWLKAELMEVPDVQN